MDGYGSYTQPNFIAKCIKNNVKVIYLPPYASHVLQPLDLACFLVIKSRYREQIANCYEPLARIGIKVVLLGKGKYLLEV